MARKLASKTQKYGLVEKPSSKTLSPKDEDRLCEIAIDKASMTGSGKSMIVWMQRFVKGKAEQFKLQTTSDLEMASREIKLHIRQGCLPA